MNPDDRDIIEAVKSARNTYWDLGENPDLDEEGGEAAYNKMGPGPTLGKGGPLMYYCEFLSVRLAYVDHLTKMQRADLTLECIERYLGTKDAPSLSLFDHGKAHNFRPLEARIGKVRDKDKVFGVVAELRSIDRSLGMPRELQDGGVACLMYHDWHIMYEMGSPWLKNLSRLKDKWGDSEKEQFLSELKSALRAKIEAEEDEDDEY